MTAISEFVAALQDAGLRLWLEDGRIRYRAPKGAVTQKTLSSLRERETELRSWLERSSASPIPRLPHAASYETSQAQRRLWLRHQFDPDSVAYNVPLHQLLLGPLDRGALENAIRLLVERHETLRTTFVAVAGEPRQVVHTALDFAVQYCDISGLADSEAAARKLGREHATRPFDLSAGPLVRVTVLCLGEDRHALLFTVHHIVADGVSVGVIASDLEQLYEAARQARSPRLASLPIQYRDFAAWQNRHATSNSSDVAYWLQKLGGAETLNLVHDLPRPVIKSGKGDELTVHMGQERSAALVELGRRHGLSLFMLLVALLKTLLHRHTGQEDIVIGTAAAGRNHADLENQVGFYLNTLALRDRVRPDMPFSTLLASVRQTATEAYEHQHYPFERLVEQLKLPRDPSRSPVFDVMLILQNRVEEGLVFGELECVSFFGHTGTSKFDLSFNFKEAPGGLVLGLEYNTDLFLPERISHMAAQFIRVADAVLADPEAQLGKLPLLSSQERERVTRAFNETSVANPSDRSVIDLFEMQAQRSPDMPAARRGDVAMTFSELDARANRLARRLREDLGFQAGDTALICLSPGFDMLASTLAVMKLRGAAGLLEPGVPVRRLSSLLRGSGSKLLIVESIPADLDFCGLVLELNRDGRDIDILSAQRPDNSGRGPDDVALLFFTSGSTGAPKPVPLTNRGIVNLLRWFQEEFNIQVGDVLPQKTAVTFVDAIVELLLPIAVTGGCVHLRPDNDTVRDLHALSEWLRDIQPTILQFVPSLFEAFLVERDIGSLPSLRALILSGGTVAKAGAPPIPTYNLYGCSECTSISTSYDMTAATALARVPIGRPIRNTSIYILDPNGEPCPMFVPGEICIGGDMVAPGYVGDAVLSERRFAFSSFRDGERIFRTGDLGRWYADGTIDFLGRRDDQVKVRGVRLTLSEVEHAMKSHPGVSDSVVVARAGPGDTELVAYVRASDLSLDAPGLRRHVATLLPQPMVPAHITFLAEFPRTSSGKIDRNALPPPVVDSGGFRASACPRDDLEAAIATLWAEALALPTVGIHDNFLDVGGHSLTASRVASRVRRDLGADISLVDVFRNPTVAELAALARARLGGGDQIRTIQNVPPATEEELAMLAEPTP